MARKNPFIYRDAVPPDRFFDRKRELELLERKLRSGERKVLVAIVGPLKFGKTSLMLKYLEMVKSYGDIIAVYIDLRKVRRPLKLLVDEVSRALRADFSETYEEAKRGETYVLFDAINDRLEERDKWLFVFLDEFHLLPDRVREEGFLTERDAKGVFSFFRAIAENRRISYIVCGSVIEPLMDALDVWGGRFDVVHLGPFSKEEAEGMMRRLFSEAGIGASDEFIGLLCDAAGYHPFYAQYMGSVVYALGRADRSALIEAKERLADFVRPIFEGYVERLIEMGEEYLRVLAKVARGERLSLKELAYRYKLYRMGFLSIKNGKYDVVDPLFKRYVLALDFTETPPDVVIVGHWAERLVGNLLVRKGYTPFYSHDSKGAFDIYVRVQDADVGIQVRYSASGEARISESEAEKMKEAADQLGWLPMLALVSRSIDFFPNPRPGIYKEGGGFKDFEEAVKEGIRERLGAGDKSWRT